jgi:hypothetical protein
MRKNKQILTAGWGRLIWHGSKLRGAQRKTKNPFHHRGTKARRRAKRFLLMFFLGFHHRGTKESKKSFSPQKHKATEGKKVLYS